MLGLIGTFQAMYLFVKFEATVVTSSHWGIDACNSGGGLNAILIGGRYFQYIVPSSKRVKAIVLPK